MKKLFFNYILISLLILTGLNFRAAAQNVQVEAKIDQTTIRIGDQTKLHLTVHQPVKELVNFPKLTDTITGKVLVVSANKPDTVIDKNNQGSITVSQTIIITSFDAGTYVVPSFSFGTKAGVLKTNQLTLDVETVKVDTTKAIYDIKQPLIVSYTFLDWLRDNWYWVLWAVIIILGIIGLIYYLRKRPKKEPVIEIVRPGLPPHIIAVNKLNELRDKKLWQQGEMKEYHSELTDIIRDYLEKRYRVKTHEKTTDEIFAVLRYLDITEENKNELRQILLLADLVKFAKEKPLPPDNERSMDSAINFVLKTQPVDLPETVKGGSDHV